MKDEEWFLEHLFYEWSMLIYTIERVQKLPSGNDYNVHHESFAVHARLVSKFLTNGDAGNYGAKDFVQNFRSRKPDEIQRLYNKIDPQVLHLASKRPNGPVGKLNSDECKTLFCWLESEFGKFFSAIPEQVQIKWNNKLGSRATAPATVSIASSLPQATNHVKGSFTTSVVSVVVQKS